jgi:hypothetical protein
VTRRSHRDRVSLHFPKPKIFAIGKLREELVPVSPINHTLPNVCSVTNRIVLMHRAAEWLRSAQANEQPGDVQYIMGALDDTA